MFDKIKEAIGKGKKEKDKDKASIERGKQETANILVCSNKKGIEKDPLDSFSEAAAESINTLINTLTKSKSVADPDVERLRDQLKSERKIHEKEMKTQ